MPTDALEHTTNGVDSSNNNGYCWHLEVACASNELPVRYKYEIWDDDIEQVIECEEYARTIGIDWDLEKRKLKKSNENKHKQQPKLGEVEDDDRNKRRRGTCRENTDEGSYDVMPKEDVIAVARATKCIVASDGHFAHANHFVVQALRCQSSLCDLRNPSVVVSF